MVAEQSPKYDSAEFCEAVIKLMEAEVSQVMKAQSVTYPEAVLIVSQVAMAPILGTTAASIGKACPDMTQTKWLIGQVLDAVYKLPDAPNPPTT